MASSAVSLTAFSRQSAAEGCNGFIRPANSIESFAHQT